MESHIIPKAVVRMVQAGAKNVVFANRHTPGMKLLQSGEIDRDLLCLEHERATAPFDKYGVEFLRRANAAFNRNPDASSLIVANPKPDIMARFALGLVWRTVHAAAGQSAGLSLGPYDSKIADAVFDHGVTKLPIVIGRVRFHLGTSPADLIYASNPHRAKFFDRNSWTFVLAGYAFHVITDARGLPWAFDDFRADKSNPVTIGVLERRDFREAGVYREAINQMRRRR